MSGFNYHYEAGTYRSRVYRIGIRVFPNLNVVESFAAVLYYEKNDEERVEVAKIDDSKHDAGAIHFDRYYRAEGAEQKDFDVDVSSVFEAEKLLAENWQRYARLYERNHGTR